MRERVLMCWSGGKDSALALDALRGDPGVEVTGLLTTVTEDVERISMHGVRRELLQRQASALGLDLREVRIPAAADNATYEARMGEALAEVRAGGTRHVAFGDLFLADIRAYRERQVAEAGLTPRFPLWHRDTTALAREFVDRGFRAWTSCVDTDALPDAFAGRALDAAFFAELPEDVDPCGENGEFHTFVWDGPGFARPVPCRPGELHRDGRFCFRDLLPDDSV